MTLAHRTLRLLLDPLIQAGQMIQMHALDLAEPLPLDNPTHTNGTILILQGRGQEPPNSRLIGLLVLLIEETLIAHPQDHIQTVIQHRVVN